MPEAVNRIEIDGESHLAVEDLAGLLSLVQIGVLEIHPWGSHDRASSSSPTASPSTSTRTRGCHGRGSPRRRSRYARCSTGLGLQSFAKTTGGKGLHVVVPLTPKLDWDAVKSFHQIGRRRLAAPHPTATPPTSSKRARQGAHLSRLSAQCARGDRGRRLFDACPARRHGLDAAVLERGRSRRPPGRLSPSPPCRRGSPR